MFLVFIMYALFASVFTVAKEALNYSTPLFLVGSRMTFAGLCMLLYQGIKKPQSIRISRHAIKKITLLAVFNIYLTNVLELWGLSYLSSFKTCFLYSLSPFISALFSYFLLSERMTKIKWIGLTIGIVGFLPQLIHQEGSQELLTQHFWYFSLPEIAIIGAVLFSVLGWIILKQLMNQFNCSPIVVNGYSMLIGGLLALVHSFLSDNWNPIPVQSLSGFIQCTLFLILVSNIISYNLYGYLLKRFSATFMAFAGLSTPLFTAFFGWLFHNEQITADFYFSIVIVSFGLFVFHSEEKRE